MSMVLDKKQMTEEDIKLQYITPAITSKWNIHKITMETQITDGKVNLKGNFVFREKPKREGNCQCQRAIFCILDRPKKLFVSAPSLG